MSSLASSRRDWADGHRRFLDRAQNPAVGGALRREVQLVTDELRRRVGSTYTVADLVEVYRDAESWARALVEESEPPAGWPLRLTEVTDAAFHQFSRGALDYEP